MSVLAFGEYRDPRSQAVRQVIERCTLDVTFVADLERLRARVARGDTRCVVTDIAAQVRELVRVLRETPGGASIALIVLVESVTAQELLELHAAGAADVVALSDRDGLARRLAQFGPSIRDGGPARFKGTCLLAHADARRRAAFGYVLEAAGFEVHSVADTDQALAAVRHHQPTIAVVSSALPPEGGRRALRRAASSVPAVLLSPGSPSAFSPQGWSVVPEDAPPDDLLFVVNEVMRPRDQLDARASRRILYGTLCTFRPSGELSARAGLTYNLSSEGLYVRTLDAPATGTEVWLELAPPALSAAVHVRGRVAWARGPSRGGRSAPPGFGLQISRARTLPDDYVALVAQYEWLLAIVSATEH